VSCEDLAPEEVLPALRTKRLGRCYSFLITCGSTNDEVAVRAAAGAEEGLLVAADQQSSGRGRRGRVWHSPPGENLYFSLLLRPALPAHLLAPLPLLVGAALAQTLASLGFSPRLKWPNDVLLDGPQGLRKVAGILVEMSSERDHVRHVVLGVGVDVNARELPVDLASVATSLRLHCGCEVDRAQVLAGFLNLFEPLYQDFLAAGPAAGLAAWRAFANFGQRCRVQSGSRIVDGIAEALDPGGALLVRTSDGTLVPVYAGEVDWPASVVS
jgi:BirA family transcriptional regulator, biotin operon repressor / biotin---[acetyl-CoA-carboxylase] ligase